MSDQKPGTVVVRDVPGVGFAVYVVNTRGETVTVYSNDMLGGEQYGVAVYKPRKNADQYGKVVYVPGENT